MKPHDNQVGPDPDSSPERLDSWKEIAEFLDKSVTTVRRWEREEGLPVHRMEHLKRGTIIAFKPELSAWMASRTTPLPESNPPVPQTRLPLRWLGIGIALIGLFGAAGAILTQPDPTPEKLILTSEPGKEHGPSFSPDGRRFAYAHNGGVWLRDVEGAVPERVCCEDKRWNLEVRWSPDSQNLAISQALAQDTFQLVFWNIAAKKQTVFAEGGPDMRWTRNGSALLFTRAPSRGQPMAIFEREIASSRERQLSFPPAGSWGDIAASQSPDGRYLAIARYSSVGRGDIFVSSYGEDNPKRITNLGNWIVGLDWMPDSGSLVFGGQLGSILGVYLVRLSGNEPPQLIRNTEGVSRYPEVASNPNGTVRIGFETEIWNTEIYTLDDAGHESPVAQSSRADQAPNLNRDDRLVFQSDRSGVHNLWLCDSGCGTPRQITFFKEATVDMAPVWSPDGSKIAFVARLIDRSSIQLMSPDGNSPRILATGQEEGVPHWSADGKFVYFRSGRSARNEIWKVPADGATPPVQVTFDGGTVAYESADGKWLYYSKGVEKSPPIRRSLIDGKEEILSEIGEIRSDRWRVEGNAIYYWTHPEGDPMQYLTRLDDIGRKPTIIHKVSAHHQVISFSISPKGRLIWAVQPPVETDIYAVDLPWRAGNQFLHPFNRTQPGL